jgi:hypothetical protein
MVKDDVWDIVPRSEEQPILGGRSTFLAKRECDVCSIGHVLLHKCKCLGMRK